VWKLKTQQNRNSKASESFFFTIVLQHVFLLKRKLIFSDVKNSALQPSKVPLASSSPRFYSSSSSTWTTCWPRVATELNCCEASAKIAHEKWSATCRLLCRSRSSILPKGKHLLSRMLASQASRLREKKNVFKLTAEHSIWDACWLVFLMGIVWFKMVYLQDWLVHLITKPLR